MYKFLIRPILFSVSPERVHHLVFNFLKLSFKIPFVSKLVSSYFCNHDTRLQRKVFGLKFPNPVGLAAGFDKDAKLVNELSCLGFGFIEIGTVTPLPQPGNPLPRMFRLPEDNALINRMGFNNEGVVEAAKRLKKRNRDILIGGNIGKNKTTPNEVAVDDYVKCFDALYEVVDYFVVNVSSPNTPDLRALQDKEPLTALLSRLKELAATKPLNKPILLKIAPDLSTQQLDEIIDIVMQLKIDGIIATNTTIERSHLLSDSELINSIGPGGLSGKPLKKHSTEVVKYISLKSKGKLPIIAVGGIHSAEDALEKLNAGATLVQVYTGFIYEGPSLIKEINVKLLNSEVGKIKQQHSSN
ncbi:MAG TPA: quinone-dependent dihydroorotate dehydrogenase [Bacteroidia bacterium]|nr:quinone-dependent dihydroorotate dehydrogenase [Bacteroidia bacterium]HRH09393.1 quinone-dependent dihydroorotate dehydrogenase [Bacteroidia bacterium]